MNKTDVEIISTLLVRELYYRIIFPDSDLSREEDLEDYRRLFETYSTLATSGQKGKIQWSSPKSSLDPTFLDETIIDRLEIEEFYINTGKVGILFLKSFEDALAIDKAFFDSVRRNVKHLSLDDDDIDEEKLINILNNIETYALSGNWRANFTDQLFDQEDVLKVVLNPSLFLVPTLVKLWLSY
jgi:hypothetical protein